LPNKHTWGVYMSRAVFLVTLVGVATLLGIGAHRLLTGTEERLAAEQFESISESALKVALTNSQRQKSGVVTLATIVEQSLPEAERWPLVHVNGYREMAQKVIETSSAWHMGFIPLVQVDRLAEFEDYAFNTVMKGDAITNRVWGMDENGQKYNETDGSTYWGSAHRIFTPFYQHSHSDVLFLMNWHSIEARGRLVDEMIECSELRAREMRDNAGNNDFSPRDCSVSTEIVDLYFRPIVEEPAVVVAQPIYPANDPTVMSGLVASATVWDRTFEGVFSSEVSGVDLVLSTDTQAFTYEVHNGIAILRGSGDLHDPDFDEYAHLVILSEPGNHSISSPRYTLTAYPSEDFFAIYKTNNPVIASIGAVCIIMFTSVLFFFYDFLVRTEFNHKESVSRARGQFVRFISHEVRTPLNAVCMGLQLLHDEVTNSSKGFSSQEDRDSSYSGSNLEERQKEHNQVLKQIRDLGQDILTNAQGAVEVLNDLLNYDKVESGTLHLELSVLPIFELVERTFAEFRQPARLKKIELTLDCESQRAETVASTDESPFAHIDLKAIGDSVRVTQVLRNLISNSLKFTPEGGKVCITTALEKTGQNKPAQSIRLYSGEEVNHPQGGVLRIEVMDTGAGMTANQLKNLFKEGVQFDVNELQAGQGSGLGLYISKGIIQQHGGTLTAHSEGKDRGTTFVLTIPLYDIPDTVKPGQAKLKRRVLDWNKLEPLRILVVDDSVVNRRLLTRLLERHGHICEEAENGRVAVERVKGMAHEGERFHCILMDYEMPELNGHSATRALRKFGCDSFVVGVTGTLFSEDVQRFMECGADAVLPKPLEMRDLMDIFVEHSVAGRGCDLSPGNE